MFISAVPRFLAGLLLAVLTYYSHAAEIEERNAVIVSDGVRLHADVYYANAGTQPLPTIIMSHGWGGTAAMLRH